MPLEDRELSYLWDMRQAAQEVFEFMKDVKFAEFEKNKALRYAVERQLLVIGEAANHISIYRRNFGANIRKSPGPTLSVFAIFSLTNMGKFSLAEFGSLQQEALLSC